MGVTDYPTRSIARIMREIPLKYAKMREAFTSVPQFTRKNIKNSLSLYLHRKHFDINPSSYFSFRFL